MSDKHGGRAPLLETSAGGKLMRQIAEILPDYPDQAAQLLRVLTNDGPSSDGEDGAQRAPRLARTHDHVGDPQGDDGHYRTSAPVLRESLEPRHVEKDRVLPARKLYIATAVKSSTDLGNLTPATIKILNLLTTTRHALSVPDLMNATNLRRKTIENVVSMLRGRGLIETRDPR